MKYLLAKVFCDDDEAEAPDLFVLRVNYVQYGNIKPLLVAVEGIVALTSEQLKAVEYEFSGGHWMIIGDETWITETLGDKDASVVDLEDVMSIVSEDTVTDRIVIDRDGDMIFTCIHHDSRMRLRTGLIGAELLEKALEWGEG